MSLEPVHTAETERADARLADAQPGTRRPLLQLPGLRSAARLGVGVISAGLLSGAVSACTDAERPTLGEPQVSSSTTVRDGFDESGEPVAEAEWTPLGEPGVAGRTTSLSYDPSSRTAMLVGGDMLGVVRTEDPSTGWDSTSGLLSWEMAKATWSPTNPDEVWIGSMSGPHRSEDGGLTWSPSRVGMPALDPDGYSAPVEVVLFDPADDQRLLAFGGSQRQWQRDFFQGESERAYGSIWESTDGGDSWTELSVLDGRPIIQAATFLSDSSTILVAALDLGVLRSDDGGATWSDASSGLPTTSVSDIVAHPTDPDTAWVTLTSSTAADGATPQLGGVFRTVDGGQSWERLSAGLIEILGDTVDNSASYERIVVASSDPNRLYTSNVARGQIGVYRSDDGGDSWQIIADADTARPEAYQSSVRAIELAVHPDDPDRVAFSQDDYLLGSTDGGETWTDLTTQAVETSDVIAATTVGFDVPLDTEFYSGRGYSGMVSNDVAFNPFVEGVMAIAAFDGGNFVGSIDGGASWNRPLTDADNNWGGAEEIRYVSETDVYVLLGQATANFRGIGVSRDGGLSFSIRAGEGIGLPNTRTDLDPTGLAVNPSDTDQLAVVVGGDVYLSSNGAETFVAGPDNLGTAYDAEFSIDGSTLWISSDSGLWQASSASGFLSASYVVGSPIGASRLTISADNASTVYVTAYAADVGGLSRYDGTWTSLLDDAQVHEVAVQPGNPDVLVAVSTDQPRRDQSLGSGVFVSVDGGETWEIHNEGLPMTRVATVEFDPFDPDRIVIGTTGRGFYETSLSGLISS